MARIWNIPCSQSEEAGAIGSEAWLPSVAGTPVCLGAGLMLYFSQRAGWCMVGTHCHAQTRKEK